MEQTPFKELVHTLLVAGVDFVCNSTLEEMVLIVLLILLAIGYFRA